MRTIRVTALTFLVPFIGGCFGSPQLTHQARNWDPNLHAKPNPSSPGPVQNPLAGATYVNSLTRNGITWTFDKDVPTFQFVNGDYYVVGPVNVISVTPAPASGSTRHGSIVDPEVGDNPYDNRIPNHDPSKAAVFPLTLLPGQILFSSESRPDNDPPQPDRSGSPQTLSKVVLKSVAALTVTAGPLTSTAFRPNIMGAAIDRVWLDSANIDYNRLPGLSLPSLDFSPHFSLPNGQTWAEYFDFLLGGTDPHPMPHWTGELAASLQESPAGYYRESFNQLQTALLILISDDPNVRKLAITMVQRGIDLYGAGLVNGLGDWRYSNTPVLIAGLLLNEPKLRNFRNQRDKMFMTHWSAVGPIFNSGVGWSQGPTNGTPDPQYYFFHKGYANLCDPTPDGLNAWWAISYWNSSHTWPWVGIAIALRALGLKANLQHDPFFAYIDWWMNGNHSYYPGLVAASNNPCGQGKNFALQWNVPPGTGGSAGVDQAWAAFDPIFP